MSTAAPAPAKAETSPAPIDINAMRQAFADATPGAGGDAQKTPETPEPEPKPPVEKPAGDPPKEKAAETLPPAPEVKGEPAAAAAEPEAAPAGEPEMPKNLTAKGQAGWKEMNKKLRDKTGEAERLRTELEQEREKSKAAANAAPAGAEETARLTLQVQQKDKELEEMRRELASSHLERTPEFKKVFSEPIANASRRITSIAAGAGVDANAFLKIADEPDEEKRRQLFKAAAGDLDSEDRTDMRTAVETLAQKKTESTRVLAESKKALDVVEQQRKERNDSEQKAKRAKHEEESAQAFRSFAKKAIDSKKAYPLLKPSAENTEEGKAWNAQLEKLPDALIAMDRDPKFLANHEARAELYTRAIAYEIAERALVKLKDTVVKENSELKEKNKTLEAAVARLSNGTPSPGDTPAAPPENEEKEDTRDTADVFAERAVKLLGK